MRWLKIFFARIVPIFLVLMLAFGAIVEVSFRFTKRQTFPLSASKVWGHRGIGPGPDENTLVAFEKAFEAGAGGVELDLFYCPEKNNFFVTHDYPAAGFKDGDLCLESVFTRTAHKGYFWLDFKNIRSLGNQDLKKAHKLLLEKLDKYDLKKKVLVEAPGPTVNLRIFKNSGLATAFTFFPNLDKGFFYYNFQIFRAKLYFLMGSFDFLSVARDLYTPDLKNEFSGFTFFVYVVNEPEVARSLINDKSIAVILTDLTNLMLLAD